MLIFGTAISSFAQYSALFMPLVLILCLWFHVGLFFATARRYHDIGLSAWVAVLQYSILALAFALGRFGDGDAKEGAKALLVTFLAIGLVNALVPSQKRTNKWGDVPNLSSAKSA